MLAFVWMLLRRHGLPFLLTYAIVLGVLFVLYLLLHAG